MRKESFSSQERIRKKKDFDRIYQQGLRLHSKNFTVLLYKPSGQASNVDSSLAPSGTAHSEITLRQRRLGVAVSKKVGNAVIRNRLKRLLREFFRRNKDRLPPARDILIIVRKNTSVLSYRDVYTELGDVLFGTLKN